jgi:uncharacterized membrane protein YedE/YeeE
MPLFHPYLQALIGGVLIGLASWLLLASLGRITGISGIAAGALFPAKRQNNSAPTENNAWRWAFLAGLVVMGAVATLWLQPPENASTPWIKLAVAGLLVGFGTVMGSGCTSGHGVCGLGRRSLRSLVATITFMTAGFATVFIAAYIHK